MMKANKTSITETTDQATTIVSAASGNAGSTGNVKISTPPKRRAPPNPRSGAKRPREPEFKHTDLPPSLSLTPRMKYIPIYTGNAQLPDIADSAYRAMKARVRSLVDVVTCEQFRYVVALAWLGRLIDININLSVAYPEGSSQLKKAVKGLLFPPAICKYIETIGYYVMKSGTRVIPFAADYRDLISLGSEWYYDPLEAIVEARRPDPDNDWSIDFDWISDYTLNVTPKMMRSGIELRTILPGDEGRAELIIGYDEQQGNLIQPISPEQQTLEIAHIGAAYRFRDYTLQNQWPNGENEILAPAFKGADISPSQIISAAMTESLRS